MQQIQYNSFLFSYKQNPISFLEQLFCPAEKYISQPPLQLWLAMWLLYSMRNETLSGSYLNKWSLLKKA